MPSIRSFGLVGAVTLLHLLAQADALHRRGGQCSAPTKSSALGCYVDNENGRTLTGPSFQNEGMTVKACRRACSRFDYFGVENGVECFCGDSLAAGTAGMPDECNLPCGGNATETCGGVNRLNVYKKDGLVLSSSLAGSVSQTGSSTAPSTTESISTRDTLASSWALSTTSDYWTSTGLSAETSASSTSSSSSSSSSSTSFSLAPSLGSSSVLPSSSSSSSSVSITTSTTLTTSTTSTFSVPSTTTAPIPTSTTSAPQSTTSTISSTSTTSTTSQCPLTTALVAGTSACWGAIPTPCTTLSSSNLNPPAGTAAASSCLSAFMSSSPVVHPSIAPCFSNLAQPTFSPQRAYSCVSAAGEAVYCPTTTKCVPTSGPLQTNIIPNGGFNAGANVFAPWILTYSSGADSMLSASVSSARSRVPPFALSVSYTNQDPGGERQYAQELNGLVPGAIYELSYYWYQIFGQTRMTSYVRFLGPGGVTIVNKEFSHFNTNAGVWVQVTERFVPNASFGTVVVGVRAVKGGGPGTLTIDEVAIKRVGW